ncbi:MAG: LysE family transporter [Candidatus Nezhaarchaeales archaeon]
MSLSFLTEVVVISASGALAPGPLTAVAATVGAKRGWKSGFLIALGHMIVELPLVMLIGIGVLTALKSALASSLLALAGGLFLLFFGSLTLKDALKFRWSIETSKSRFHENPILVGILLSILNPFFIVWWLGIGSPLIYKAIGLWGLQGIMIMYASHVWLDFAWLPLITYSASLGRFNVKILRILLFALALAVLYFGFSFIISGLGALLQ